MIKKPIKLISFNPLLGSVNRVYDYDLLILSPGKSYKESPWYPEVGHLTLQGLNFLMDKMDVIIVLT